MGDGGWQMADESWEMGLPSSIFSLLSSAVRGQKPESKLPHVVIANVKWPFPTAHDSACPNTLNPAATHRTEHPATAIPCCSLDCPPRSPVSSRSRLCLFLQD